MLKTWIRVLKNDNGTITDLSLDNESNSTNMAFPIVAAEDEILIGKYYPFNNFHMLIGTANTDSSSMQISYWDGKEWQSAVDILDGTSSSGASLAKSGNVQFSTQRDYRWTRVDDTSDTNSTPTELQGETIYHLYWMKITFSNDLDAGTEIQRFFYQFTDTQTITGLDIELSNYLTTFGQSTWDQQIFTASKELLIDLKSRSIIQNEGQLLRLEDVFLPAAYKTLAIIYFNLGDDYRDKRQEVINMYNSLMKTDNFTIDVDLDGYVDKQEIDTQVRRLVRA